MTRHAILRSASPVALRMSCALGGLLIACTTDVASVRPVETTGTPDIEILRPITLAPWARLPATDPSYEEVEVHEDRLRFRYQPGASPNLAPGNVVSGTATGRSYLRRVKGVEEADDGWWEVRTAQAQLTELIQDGHFRMRIDPGRQGQAITLPAAGDDAASGGVTQALNGASFDLLGDLGIGTSAALPCPGTGGGAATAMITVDPTLRGDLAFDYELDIALLCIREARFIVEGELEASITVQGSAEGNFMCTVNLVEAPTGPLWSSALHLLGTEIAIEHHVTPTGTMTLSATGGPICVELGAGVTYAFRAGVQYTQEAGLQVIRESSPLEDVLWSRLELSGDPSFQAELSLQAGVQYAPSITGLSLPVAGLMASVDGDFNASEGAGMCAADRLGWEASLSGTIEASLAGAVGIDFFDLSLADLDERVEIGGTLSATSSGCADLPPFVSDTCFDFECGMVTDPCACGAEQRCGWCGDADSGSCMGTASPLGDAPDTCEENSSWETRESLLCADCSATTEQDCVSAGTSAGADALCGWCGASRECMPALGSGAGGQPASCASDWIFLPSQIEN